MFPVVAIGASAGGIEAISKLLENLSADLGMAYVIIQHLVPNHESILPELLERRTKMPVHQVENGMQVLQNNVYVIPPNTYMAIENNKLKLSPRVKTDGSFHSIDFFLNAMAPVYKNNAIAVILSGSASDGTVGIQSIKSEGGVTFAQDSSAKFQSMPDSAIDSGYIDFVLSPQNIARQLKAFPKIIYSVAAVNTQETKISEPELKKIHYLLHNKYDVDFSHYKQSTINRRILRRMVLNRMGKTADYIKLLQKDSHEVELLYKDLLISVTSFFRDTASYTLLAKKIFPALMKNRTSNDPLRVWIPACATGEEAYSTAICLFEWLKDKAVTTATDLNEIAIEKARSGVYPKGGLQNVSPQRLKKFFVPHHGSYQIIKPIRDVCVFATHDLLKDPPFSRMDLVSCQNVMIYLESAPQKKILQAFHYSLKPGGFLLLGKSETIGSSSDLFIPANKDQKIYTKKDTGVHPTFDLTVLSYYPQENQLADKKLSTLQIGNNNIDKEAEKLLLSKYIPASVVVDKDLHVQRFLGAPTHYLQPVSGKASLHLLKLVREDLVFHLRNLLHRAKKENKPVKKEGIVISENGHSKELNLEVIPIKQSSRDLYYLILFREMKLSPSEAHGDSQKQNGRDVKTKKDSKDQTIARLEQEVGEVREHIRTMSEEFEATKEELQSSNEEVLSSNEELQSLNEELETSKEELQSSNEELTTINEELERRNNELREAVDYSQAIVQTIDEPLILLKSDMRIKTANRAFYRNFKTSDDEVEGLNFFEISHRQWNIPELRNKLTEVFSMNKNFEQFELQHVFPVLGERILRLNAIRINKDDPKKNTVLLVLEDITQRKKAEWQLKESEERFRLLVQNASDIITILSAEGVIIYESESLENILGYTPKERIGKNIFKDTIVHPDDIVIKENAFRKAISTANETVKAEFRLRHKDGGYRDIEAIYVNMLANPRVGGIIANYHDVTEQRKLELQREEFVSIASHELKTPVTSIKGYIQIMQDIFSSANDGMSGDLLNKLHLQVDRLTHLIKELLDITTIRQGQLEFRESKFEIDKIITETVEEMQLGSKKHLIVADLKAAKKITADKDRISQVLTNLISNATKYSPGADKIVVTSTSSEEIVTICVQDFGIGISADVQKKIFDRFFRLSDKSHTFPGLGLGLYIASEIVRRHGGQFSVDSVPGKGSVFCFTLPIEYSPA